MLKRLTAVTAVLVAVVTAGVWAATPSSAHALLLSTSPPPGGQLRPGGQVVLYFDDPVVPADSSVALIRRSGARFVLAPLTHSGGDVRSLSATLPERQPAGAVELRWTALADDGHVTTGTVPFHLTAYAVLTSSVTGPPATGPPASGRVAVPSASAGNAGISRGLAASRLLGYLALCLLCGGLVFIVTVWPAGADARRARAVLWTGLAAGLASSVAAVLFEAAYVERVTTGEPLSLNGLTTFLDTPVGRLWAARVLLFLLALPVVRTLAVQGERAVRSTAWRLGAGAVGIGLLRTPGLLGHTAEARQGPVGSAADLVHMTGVAVWVGGLVLLAIVVLPRRNADELASIMPRFSALALVSVAGVVLAGAFMTWQLVGSVHSATSTHYGHMLLLKLGVVGGVLLAASRSKAWVGRRLEHAVVLGGDRITLRPLVLSVGTEVVLAVTALTVASVLVNTPPGR